MKKIIIGITGSIAAFKTIQLISDLNKMDYDIEVVMTESASKFVTTTSVESIIKKKVYIDIFDDNPTKITHIDLVKDADLYVVVPASANTIAKIANGIADNMLTASYLAATCKKMICPAMNTNMYNNPVTLNNIEKLKNLNTLVVEPETGILACGTTGKGKLASNEDIKAYIDYCLHDKTLIDKNILITAGPTIEKIDPVRYITNHSSGKMGYAIARAAFNLGANVTLISGPTSISKPIGVNIINVNTANEMFEACKKYYMNQDYIIKAAAVSDYRPLNISDQKIKKFNNNFNIELTKNIDILDYLGKHKTNQIICGFAMETNNLIENAIKKLNKKNCDMLVANNLNDVGAGFSGDTNKVSLIFKDNIKEIGLMSKEDLAYVILNELVKCGG